VLVLRARRQGRPANRSALALLHSREDWRHANAGRRDELPRVLPAGEARILVNHLCAGLPRAGRRGEGLSWQDLRNRTAVALHLGAGLTPADVRVLDLASPVARPGDGRGEIGTVRIPAHGDSPEREAPLAPWAGRLLGCWQRVRLEQRIAGTWLLPATRSGRPWSKVAHHEAVIRVLEASGIDPVCIEGGSFRLRHTFALRQLRRGKPPQAVAAWLGVVEAKVMDRYRRFDHTAERPE
jgi:integrase